MSSQSSQSQPIKLLQITDTHLFEAHDGSLLSVNTGESFKSVVNAVLDSGYDYEAILATGDISQDHSAASYQRFADGIVPLEKACYWLPGNHDYKPNMGSVFEEQAQLDNQIQQVEHVLLGDNWQIVLLDSQVVGVPHGRLSDQQLALLDNKLAQYPERYALVLLHHHPILVGSAWLDQHTLKDSDALWDVIAKHSNVKAILCGHVHQDMVKDHNGVLVMATPSTCVQFKPNSDDFALDNQSPGWREINLNPDGSVDTVVKRLGDGQFLPDFSADGY